MEDIYAAAFYVMNSKGLYALDRFIEKFGAISVAYVVSERDKGVQDDLYSEIKTLSEQKKIPFYKRSSFSPEIEESFDGIKFAIGWRWLIENEEKLIIFHDSLLPKYRGFSPLVNLLINKERRGGVTALFADCRYDAGDIIGQKSVEFKYPLKIDAAIRLVEPLYSELVDEIFQQLQSGKELFAQEQDDNLASYSLWLDEEDYFIDWSWAAEKIKRFVDAVGYPYGGARAILNKEPVGFAEVATFADVEVAHRERHIGKVIFFEQGCPVVLCCEGMLVLKKVVDSEGNQVRCSFRSRFK